MAYQDQSVIYILSEGSVTEYFRSFKLKTQGLLYDKKYILISFFFLKLGRQLKVGEVFLRCPTHNQGHSKGGGAQSGLLGDRY